MKKTYIKPETAIMAVSIDRLLYGGSDYTKDGEILEAIPTGDGEPDDDDIYWGNAKENSVWDGWED